MIPDKSHRQTGHRTKKWRVVAPGPGARRTHPAHPAPRPRYTLPTGSPQSPFTGVEILANP